MATNPSTNTFREFPPCSSDLKMLPIFGGWKTVKILCDGEVKWDTNVRTNLVQVADTFTKVDEKVSKTSGKSKLPKIKVVVLHLYRSYSIRNAPTKTINVTEAL